MDQKLYYWAISVSFKIPVAKILFPLWEIRSLWSQPPVPDGKRLPSFPLLSVPPSPAWAVSLEYNRGPQWMRLCIGNSPPVECSEINCHPCVASWESHDMCDRGKGCILYTQQIPYKLLPLLLPPSIATYLAVVPQISFSLLPLSPHHLAFPPSLPLPPFLSPAGCFSFFLIPTQSSSPPFSHPQLPTSIQFCAV